MGQRAVCSPLDHRVDRVTSDTERRRRPFRQPTNRAAIAAFHYHVFNLWHRRLCRRSQRARLVWTRMAKRANEFLPKPRVSTLGRACALPSDTQGRSRVPELGSLGSVRGALSNGRPYRECVTSGGKE